MVLKRSPERSEAAQHGTARQDMELEHKVLGILVGLSGLALLSPPDVGVKEVKGSGSRCSGVG